MTTTSTVSSNTATTGSSQTSRKTIAENFDAFLLLLTTQLQNQSPLDPMDANQFTQQLVQFATVEQQIKTNDTLTSLVDVSMMSQATAALSMIGNKVTAAGTTMELKDGKAEWTFEAAKSGVAVISVLDSNGSTVFAQERAMTAGANTFTWDGKTSTGSTLKDGVYTLKVSGRDATGTAVAVSTEIAGTVDGVDVSGSIPVLKVGKISIPLSTIRSVSRL